MGNQPNLVKLLLAAGAEVNVPDEDDLTPLHVAARYSVIRACIHHFMRHSVESSKYMPTISTHYDLFNPEV